MDEEDQKVVDIDGSTEGEEEYRRTGPTPASRSRESRDEDDERYQVPVLVFSYILTPNPHPLI